MSSDRPRRFLFVKSRLAFPRSSGHDVHSYYMMKALGKAGHEMCLLTVDAPTCDAIKGLELLERDTFEDLPPAAERADLTGLQRRFCSYWGIPEQRINQVAAQAKRLDVDAVVVVGLEVLPYLAGVQNAQRIWYAADEWLWHHASQVFLHRPSTYAELKPGLIKGAYEWAFAPRTDRVWVVSESDRRAVRMIMRGVAADTIPNGVDTDHFAPIEIEQIPRSCTFWGRLDFGPNVDAVRWFAVNVWQQLKSEHPDARFDVFGFAPTEEVQRLAETHHFSVHANMPDLRREIARRQLVVLPFISGGGMKNKFLEAAAMAKPIIASPRALNGVKLPADDVLKVASRPSDWAEQIRFLWQEKVEAEALGSGARRWIKSDYSWDRAALSAVGVFQ